MAGVWCVGSFCNDSVAAAVGPTTPAVESRPPQLRAEEKAVVGGRMGWSEGGAWGQPISVDVGASVAQWPRGRLADGPSGPNRGNPVARAGRRHGDRGQLLTPSAVKRWAGRATSGRRYAAQRPPDSAPQPGVAFSLQCRAPAN